MLINCKEKGETMSNTNQTHSGSGDNIGRDVNINYNFQGAKFGGGFAGRDYTGDVNNQIFNNQPNDPEIKPKFKQYLTKIQQKLRTEGSLDIQQNLYYKNQPLNLVSKITNFELSFGLFSMRGDAFFIFSYLPLININLLQRYANHCLEYATEKATSSTVGQITNFKVPTNICFAIALVDQLEPETKHQIKTQNPFDIETDTLWYKVPVVYCLNETKLYFYDQPTSFWENFKGEIVWKKLREVIETTLKPDL